MNGRPAGRARVVLFEDLNCPFCYALTEALHDEGLHRYTSWRGVEHAPDAPIPWVAPGPSLHQMLLAEVDTVRRRAPALPIRNPFGQPNTGAAIRAVADLAERDDAAAVRLRRRIKWALFRDNLDISDPDVLARLKREEALDDAPLTPERESAVRASQTVWQAEWRAMTPRMIPLMIGPDGTVRRGLGDPADAVAFVKDQLQREP